MGPGDEALQGLPAGDGTAGGVCALCVPGQSEWAGPVRPELSSWGSSQS